MLPHKPCNENPHLFIKLTAISEETDSECEGRVESASQRLPGPHEAAVRRGGRLVPYTPESSSCKLSPGDRYHSLHSLREEAEV